MAEAGLDKGIPTKLGLIEGWAELIDRYEWQGFWTLTFEKDFRFWSARKAFIGWARRFTLPEPHSLSFLGFTEWGHRWPEVPHIHALTRNETKTRRHMWAYWFPHYGRARSEAYDASQGGRYYLGKYLTKEDHEVILDERQTLQGVLK